MAEQSRADGGVQCLCVYVCSAVYVASQQGLHWETEGRERQLCSSKGRHGQAAMQCHAMRCDAGLRLSTCRAASGEHAKEEMKREEGGADGRSGSGRHRWHSIET